MPLPQVAPPAPLALADRQYSLSRLASIAGLAAAAAVSVGRSGRPIELLEQARGTCAARILDLGGCSALSPTCWIR
jgi:hypothetical protein